ncbi:MAG: DUF1573 domain-containing protein, partial [Alistipes sp.]|nr:DUF1573 domain-containing protein [Alistipes sp.]
SISALAQSHAFSRHAGIFTRKIIVVTSEGELKEQLLVKGTVKPRKLSIEERFPLMLGSGVCVGVNAHSFGYVEHGKVNQSTFEIYNDSKQTVTLSVINPYPELSFYIPKSLGPGKEAVINFDCLLPENSSVYGSLSYSVWLVINGKKARYPFIVNGLAIDSRGENANNRSQMIAMSENFIKFGAVKRNVAKLSRTIEVQNTGKKAIVIRKLELASNGFVADLDGNATIPAGGKRKIRVTIYPEKLPYGAVVKKLLVVSNDPKKPVITVRVSAIIED